MNTLAELSGCSLTRRYETAADAKVGDSHEWERTFEKGDVERMGQASGDRNPLHFDAAYAAQTRFKRPIVHGVSTLCEISRMFGNEFPGHGTIFLGIEKCSFLGPVHHGDTVRFKATIAEIRKNRLTFEIDALVGSKQVLRAVAIVMLDY